MKKIRLSTGRYAIIDDCDFEAVSKFNWHEGGRGYPQATMDGVETYMHRFLLGAKKGQTVDHINGNMRDNRRDNIRLCSIAENGMNRAKPFFKAGTTSRFKGVMWRKRSEKWQATLNVKRNAISLGLFETQEAAARAYDVAAKKMFGGFAYQNFAN